MRDVVIRVQGLSKQYRIGSLKSRHDTLRDYLSDGLGRLLRGSGRRAAGQDVIWALKDVSFDVREGEIIGIVGRNGAGKTTLLKVLSRITEPTAGRAEIRGRTRAMLEVGTGFHRELTGRENIYLNGAILGMKRREIDEKFDDIVTFSELEKFIDTPVKHYSSGMSVRLAFSVAAHLEPEILLVDEVLAVGDASFWSKCINKMRFLNEQGMTILLVTHQMWLVQTMCSRAICLDWGSILADGEPLRVISAYRDRARAPHLVGRGMDLGRRGPRAAEIVVFQVLPKGESTVNGEITSDSAVEVVLAARVKRPLTGRFFVRMTSPDGLAYFSVFSDVFDASEGEEIECVATIPRLMVLSGEYYLWAGICQPEVESGVFVQASVPLFVSAGGQAVPHSGMFQNHADWQVRSRG